MEEFLRTPQWKAYWSAAKASMDGDEAPIRAWAEERITGDGVSRARKSSSYGGENWRRAPDFAKLRDMPREEAIRVAILIYGWNAAEATERVDTEQGRYAEEIANRKKQQ